MEVLKNVLIKEADGDSKGDKVFIIDNLPKSLLYRKGAKLIVDYTNPQQNMVPDFELDERGRKIPTGAVEDQLLEGIEISNYDKGYVFFTANNTANERLKAIDGYIKSVAPVLERIPRREPYSLQPGVMTAGPRPLSDLPRVVLPEPVSPPEQSAQVSGNASGSSKPEVAKETKPFRRPWTEEQKIAARERMARAREVQKAKQTGQIK